MRKLPFEQLLKECLTRLTTSPPQSELWGHPVTVDRVKQLFLNKGKEEKRKQKQKKNDENTFAKCFAKAPVKITTPSRTKSYFSSSDA